MLLNDLKILLDITGTDMDDKLNLILESVTDRLKLLVGGVEPTPALNHVIIEVAIIRFNRIGSEGAKSHSVEGESLTYQDSDFDSYKDEIEAFRESQIAIKKGRVRFI